MNISSIANRAAPLWNRYLKLLSLCGLSWQAHIRRNASPPLLHKRQQTIDSRRESPQNQGCLPSRQSTLSPKNASKTRSTTRQLHVDEAFKGSRSPWGFKMIYRRQGSLQNHIACLPGNQRRARRKLRGKLRECDRYGAPASRELVRQYTRFC